MKVSKEWFVTAPWGKIALISWGTLSGEPVLLVHGREDSAATFLPLLEYLPTTYCYVALDLPGHGRSDPFPKGLPMARPSLVVAIEITIEHLKWDKFIYLAHSMGCELGLYYNALHPNQIKKNILLDPAPAFQRFQNMEFATYFHHYYDQYYQNYEKFNGEDRVYSGQKALEAVMRSRKLTEEEARVVLSRNLTRVGDDQYRLSWDRRLKIPAPFNLSNEFYFELFSKNLPPTLLLAASDNLLPSRHDKNYEAIRKQVDKFILDLQNKSRHFYVESVIGTHDVHLTNPARIEKFVNNFLKTDFVVSKL